METQPGDPAQALKPRFMKRGCGTPGCESALSASRVRVARHVLDCRRAIALLPHRIDSCSGSWLSALETSPPSRPVPRTTPLYLADVPSRRPGRGCECLVPEVGEWLGAVVRGRLPVLRHPRRTVAPAADGHRAHAIIAGHAWRCPRLAHVDATGDSPRSERSCGA